ncbi:DUF3592 domain-containing protein [Colwellia sp. MSW7]|uniref:DUF3592 domain-containing protein n=1 Tax=Colwellia maritima TaxID=2912588 RepID=A0ABS9WXD2_9GAMM|nr:DUF3592 domain-containing protein [Colwellia maritima]MCI2282465.1 DUF3592 domain-containing protein [Colwellia maritima]
MCVAPAAMFTNNAFLDSIAWVMLIILGVFIFITGIVTRKEAIDSHNWPKVEAKLLRASLKSTSSGSGGRSYTPDIKCKFIVGGSEFKGTEYDLSAGYGSKAKAEDKINLVKQMNPLFIHYKPSAPEINVINPGIHFTHYIRIIIGIVTVIFPLLIWSGIIELR